MTNIQYIAYCLDCDEQLTDHEANFELHECEDE
jgi:hypothetical protein